LFARRNSSNSLSALPTTAPSTTSFTAPLVLCQPMAGDDVASALVDVVVSAALNRTLEIAGPEQFRLDEFIRRGLRAHVNDRAVVADARQQ
jgi:hypothetical protein